MNACCRLFTLTLSHISLCLYFSVFFYLFFVVYLFFLFRLIWIGLQKFFFIVRSYWRFFVGVVVVLNFGSIHCFAPSFATESTILAKLISFPGFLSSVSFCLCSYLTASIFIAFLFSSPYCSVCCGFEYWECTSRHENEEGQREINTHNNSLINALYLYHYTCDVYTHKKCKTFVYMWLGYNMMMRLYRPLLG